MEFKNLKERMLYYRDLTDYKVMPNCYTLVMLDGRSFSKMIKNKYKKPFDDNFIEMMNETAEYICRNVQGALFAYVQSDEISILLSDNCDMFFGGRLCKMQSIIASMASAKFNQLATLRILSKFSKDEAISEVKRMGLCEFDCKVWNVPSYNDVFGWFLFRQNDCIRNSKCQAVQTYLSHKQLLNLDCEEQIKRLRKEKSIDWNTAYDDGKKYGRFIYKEAMTMNVYVEKLQEECVAVT